MTKETPNRDWREWMRGLGRQARRVREFLGLSQEQIARLAGISQGAISRLEGGRGLATPLLVVMKLNIAMRSLLATYDPELLSPEARELVALSDTFYPEAGTTHFIEYPLAKDCGIEELVRLYRELPERQRDKLLAVVRATTAALSPSADEAQAPVVKSQSAS